jgi:predicted ATPase
VPGRSGEPVILVLEDCHWIDPLSRDLLEVLGRATARLPVLIVLAYRPTSEPGGGLGVDRIPDFSEIVLDQLRGDDALGLIRLKLEQVAPGAATAGIPEPFVDLLMDRSDGNPFYVEELISWIAARGVDPSDAEALRALELPESLHSLVLSRIDSMNDAPRRTLKVASVVGRVFEAPILPGAYPELGTLDEVLQQLDELRTVDLISLDRDLEHAYLFKHVATQEVAYESLPFGLRARLHGRIGDWIETSDPDRVDRHLDLLAHHFWLSDDEERKRSYLSRAADAAREAYANDAAIRYLERLIPLLDGRDRVSESIGLAQVLHVTGDIPSATTIVEEVRPSRRTARRRRPARALRPLAGRVGASGRPIRRRGPSPGARPRGVHRGRRPSRGRGRAAGQRHGRRATRRPRPGQPAVPREPSDPRGARR